MSQVSGTLVTALGGGSRALTLLGAGTDGFSQPTVAGPRSAQAPVGPWERGGWATLPLLGSQTWTARLLGPSTQGNSHVPGCSPGWRPTFCQASHT